MGNGVPASPSNEEEPAIGPPQKRPSRHGKWLLPIRPPGPVPPDALKAAVRSRLAILSQADALRIYLDLPPNHNLRRQVRHRGPLISHHDRLAVVMDFTGGDLNVGEVFILSSYGFFFHSRQHILDRECCFVPWFEFASASPLIHADPQQATPPCLRIGHYRCSPEKLTDSNFADFLLAVLLDVSFSLHNEVGGAQPQPALAHTLAEVVVSSGRTVTHTGAFWVYPAIGKEVHSIARDVATQYCSDEVLIAIDHCAGDNIMDLGWTIVTTEHVIFSFSKQKFTLLEFATSTKIDRDPLMLACPHRDSVVVITTPLPPLMFAQWLLTLQQDLRTHFGRDAAPLV